MALTNYLAGEVAEDFADGLLSRREALRRLVLLGVSLTAAGQLLAACGGDDGDDEDAAATTLGDNTTTTGGDGAGETITFDGKSGRLTAAWAEADDPKAALLVVHENRGLTPHFFDVVARFAAEGYSALCVDLLSPEGGTASMSDEAAAPTALSSAPLERLLGDLGSGIDELRRRVDDKKVGAIGFCFGGGMVWNLLNTGEARLAAAAPFYGPAPADADFSRAKAAVFAVYGELDTRVNASRDAATAALEKAKLVHEVKTYPGADHAFFNDAGPRYNASAATQVFKDVNAWFDEHLA